MAIIWAALDPARDYLIAELQRLCSRPDAAKTRLKLGKNSEEHLAKNLSLYKSPTLPAIRRYKGVLFDALDFDSLSAKAKQLVGERVFIQSALFGLLPAMEGIPDYKFSATSSLQGINLAEHWRAAHQAVWPRLVGDFLDLRSKVYQELNPVPADRCAYRFEVLDERGRALNHFNKKAKGHFVRAAMEHSLNEIQDLPRIAKAAGFKAEVDGQSVRLIVPKTF